MAENFAHPGTGFTPRRLALLRQRQDELGLPNAALEQVCGLSGGQANRWLGAGREKSPTLASLCLILDGLGLSGTLHVDPVKERRVRALWTRAGQRVSQQVRAPARVSKIAIARARSVVMSEMARRAALARWAKTSKTERQAVRRFLNSHRTRTESSAGSAERHQAFVGERPPWRAVSARTEAAIEPMGFTGRRKQDSSSKPKTRQEVHLCVSVDAETRECIEAICRSARIVAVDSIALAGEDKQVGTQLLPRTLISKRLVE